MLKQSLLIYGWNPEIRKLNKDPVTQHNRTVLDRASRWLSGSVTMLIKIDWDQTPIFSL